MPGVHGRQNACPSSFCLNPNAHDSHRCLSATPTLAEYRPILQLLQASGDDAASVIDHLPLPQFSQSESLVFPFPLENFPGIQAVQTDSNSVFLATPSLSLYRPTVHFLHPSFVSCFVESP